MKKFLSIALVAILSMVLNCGGNPSDPTGNEQKKKDETKERENQSVLLILYCNNQYDTNKIKFSELNDCINLALRFRYGFK
ncbi:MAG: hypothetical protein SFU98_11775 [Leptospiraceae bacterium]|nr:hypothetical protein [Leptospiraceae bacterium]